jgi:hypothetical protein
LGLLFSFILCTCPNQRNLCSFIVCYLRITYISLLVNILKFSFSLSHIKPRIPLYTSKKCSVAFYIYLFVGSLVIFLICIITAVSRVSSTSVLCATPFVTYINCYMFWHRVAFLRESLLQRYISIFYALL